MKKYLACGLAILMIILVFGKSEARAGICGDCHCVDADCDSVLPAPNCPSACGNHGGTYCSVQQYCKSGTCLQSEIDPETKISEVVSYPNCHWCDASNFNCQVGCCTECAWSCGSCDAECESYGTKTCTGVYCGGTKTESCYNSTSCCDPTSPAAPTAVSPTTIDNYTEKTGTAMLEWTAVTVWNEECDGSAARGYEVCIGPNSADPCTGTGSQDVFVAGEITTSTNISGLSSAINYWKVRAKNKAGMASTWTSSNSFCYYGSDPVNPLSLSVWSACDSDTHHRTRTCIVGCDCTGLNMDEVCNTYIRGTIFDASYIDTCPGDTNGDGYIDENIPSDAVVASQPFLLIDQAATLPSPTNGWGISSFSVTTNGQGNYSANVYSPATYEYDFTPMGSVVDVTSGPKLSCTSTVATALGNTTTCLTQPCIPYVTNMNFGFWKVFGGWWQVVGGNIYGASGITSIIPGSLVPSTNQRLMLADENGRYGTLIYGLLVTNQLGTNPNAALSNDDNPKEILSVYDGLRYDYNFYKTRMDVFGSTTWDGGEVAYTDGGKGYQIFKHTGNVDLAYGGPTGTDKVILLVDGDVTINSNILVPDGAFFAVITSGDITFNQAVTDAQGWFVAENINVSCHDEGGDGCDGDDAQFNGKGSFVGWKNINLRRNQGLPNNQAPSEKFTYSAEMMLNAPEPMRVYTRKFTPFVP